MLLPGQTSWSWLLRSTVSPLQPFPHCSAHPLLGLAVLMGGQMCYWTIAGEVLPPKPAAPVPPVFALSLPAVLEVHQLLNCIYDLKWFSIKIYNEFIIIQFSTIYGFL